MGNTKRFWYINNLRIFLISLVVLHHLAITYGAPGDWYYNESQAEMPGVILEALPGKTWCTLSLGFSLIICLLGLFKKYFNRQGRIARLLSGSAYAVFIIHSLVLVAISAVFTSWQAPQIVKLVSLAPLVLIACFLCAFLLQRLPVAKKKV